MKASPIILLTASALTAILHSPFTYAQSTSTSTSSETITPAKSSVSIQQLDTIIVSGSSNRDDRRESTTAKIVVTREELERFGDNTIGDVLKRIPGVTVNSSATPGRGGEIRMRGLGSGYTQILINGEPTAPGFSLESISPNLIERIEVMRTATADLGTQAIAGTINIILKRAVSQRQRDIKATISGERGHPTINLDTLISDRDGPLSYTIAGSLSGQKYFSPSIITQQGADTQGQRILEHKTERTINADIFMASLAPRIRLKLGEQDLLVSESFLSYQNTPAHILNRQSAEFGAPSLYGDDRLNQTTSIATARERIIWTHDLDDSAKIEVKLGMNSNRMNQKSSEIAALPGKSLSDESGVALARASTFNTTDDGLTLSGNYHAPYQESHAMLLGWDSERTRRSEKFIQRDTIALVAPVNNIDGSYEAFVQRLAFFAQDEWSITPRWSVYAGLRWENLETRSEGNAQKTVISRSGVLSPIFQSLWKVPDTQGDQVRLGLSRTYKAPLTKDLMAQRFFYYDNTPTTPDVQGNPNLRPELAWGLDAAYERHFGKDGLLSANVFMRRIHDVIVQEIFLDNGRWVRHPINDGDAQVRGFELEAKTNLHQLVETASDIDLRANLARNWSSLDAVPGPNNRLAGRRFSQSPVPARLSMDL